MLRREQLFVLDGRQHAQAGTCDVTVIESLSTVYIRMKFPLYSHGITFLSLSNFIPSVSLYISGAENEVAENLRKLLGSLSKIQRLDASPGGSRDSSITIL